MGNPQPRYLQYRTYGIYFKSTSLTTKYMDQDHPTTPYSLSEQRQILRDVEESKRTAFAEQDAARTFYLNQIDND